MGSIDGCCRNSLAHHKVYDWLNTSSTDFSRSKSSVNLDCSITSESDYQLIYRAKSEQHISLIPHRSMDTKCSPLAYTSLNCLPVIGSSKNSESKLNDSITEESSLIWDNFQMGHGIMKVDSESGLMGNDSETKELTHQLCYFGDDYSLHFNETNCAECESSSDMDLQKQIAAKKYEKDHIKKLSTASSSSEVPQKESTGIRRSRRIRKRRSTLNSMSSSDQSSKSRSSATTTTASIDSVKNGVGMQANQSTDEFTPDTTISYNSSEKQFEMFTKESKASKKIKINEMRPDDFYDVVKMCQSNIDCVITVLGAAPNRELTVTYCQQMKFERYQKSGAETICKCKHEHNDANNSMLNSPGAKNTECKCCTVSKADSAAMCVCAWVNGTIAMILNFLMDCWNVFRNMKLYTYLCRFMKALFGSTRYVADHLRSTQALTNAKLIKYS